MGEARRQSASGAGVTFGSGNAALRSAAGNSRCQQNMEPRLYKLDDISFLMRDPAAH